MSLSSPWNLMCIAILLSASYCQENVAESIKQTVQPPTLARSNSRVQKSGQKVILFGNSGNRITSPSLSLVSPLWFKHSIDSLQYNPGHYGSCYKGDIVCEKDRLGYEAISTLHHQMDDDENGDIDLEESAEFLREELQSQWSDDRSKKFHMNDTHITVDDLWSLWKNSSVHNWTVEQVVLWLTYDVELPQYTDTFRINVVDGCTLPRLAVNNLNFVSNILGIKNLVHKQKLANKATDVVLFGPPKYRHNWFKDVVIAALAVMAVTGIWFAYRQSKQLEVTMAKTMADMDSLAKSEEALKDLQAKLKREELEKHQHIQHKEQLEEKMKYDISEARLEAQKLKLTKEQTDTQLSQMKETRAELERTREALLIAQKELEVRNSLAPSLELQKWLQITYELELKAYNEKKASAEQQLLNAKDSCEKLRKKKQALFGSLRMAHSGNIDETEHIIVSAKNALEEVKHDLAERQYRWQQVETMCHFSIMSNPGIESLIQSTGHADLYRFCHGGSLLEGASPELDDFDDRPPTYGAAVAALQRNGCSTSKRRKTADSAARSELSKPVAAAGSSQHVMSSKSGVMPAKSNSSSRTLLLKSRALAGCDGSSRASSEEPHTTGSVQSCDDVVKSSTTGLSNESDDSIGVRQPRFGLGCDEHDSSSTSSTDNNASNIPVSSKLPRPPLVRHVPLRQTTDSMSVCSEQVGLSSASVDEVVLRTRSRTNESLDKYKQNKLRAKTVDSPLVTSSESTGCGTNLVLTNKNSSTLNQMKRSYTTTDAGLNRFNGKALSSPSMSDTYPESAPASITAPSSISLSQGNDSDASVSSESKDGDSINVRKSKSKKKLQLFKLFKSKPHTS